MTRPFSLTMQAHQLDLHGLWMGLLITGLGMSLLWVAWAVTGEVSLYENSIRVEPSPQSAVQTTYGKKADDAEEDGEAGKSVRQRCFTASFPTAARGKLAPGQEAVVFARDGASKGSLTTVITEAGEAREVAAPSKESPAAPIRAVVCVPSTADSEDEDDPPAQKGVDRIRVVVGKSTPLKLLFPTLAL